MTLGSDSRYTSQVSLSQELLGRYIKEARIESQLGNSKIHKTEMRQIQASLKHTQLTISKTKILEEMPKM